MGESFIIVLLHVCLSVTIDRNTHTRWAFLSLHFTLWHVPNHITNLFAKHNTLYHYEETSPVFQLFKCPTHYYTTNSCKIMSFNQVRWAYTSTGSLYFLPYPRFEFQTRELDPFSSVTCIISWHQSLICELIQQNGYLKTRSFILDPCNKNKLDALFILSLFRQSTSSCFGHICCPSSGAIPFIYNNWYMLCWKEGCLKLLKRIYISL
jgi:hypothetical protein